MVLRVTKQGVPCESGLCCKAPHQQQAEEEASTPADGTPKFDKSMTSICHANAIGAEPLVVQASTSRRRFAGKGRGEQSSQQDTSTVLVQGMMASMPSYRESRTHFSS